MKYLGVGADKSIQKKMKTSRCNQEQLLWPKILVMSERLEVEGTLESLKSISLFCKVKEVEVFGSYVVYWYSVYVV